jgi:tetratricopeptide (TPR) repeat protein
VVLSVSYVHYEKDFWQHLAVGRALWQLHAVPVTQLWTWPTYGAPAMTPSWGFRALIWPVWEAGGVGGLYAWRWLTTLAVFALALATARRMGARGMTPLVVIALCALTYRQRSQVRPETLAAVWLALTLALFEWRRSGWSAERLRLAGPWRDPAWLFVPIAWAWVNSHVSHPLGWAALGAYLLDALARRRPGAARLAIAGGAAVAASLLNPYGWRAVLEPLEFFASQRNEPIFRIIPELYPLDLRYQLKNLLPLVLVGWPLLIAWRAARRRVDWAEVALAAGLLALSFGSNRFLGFTMVVAAPFLGRDLDAWVASRRWPAWTSPAWARAGLAASACLGLGIAEWSRDDLRLGVGLKLTEYPVAACDFIAREAIEGRGFNQFYLGGYLLHRFWPDRERLPFMDIHVSGTREDRDLYTFAMTDARAWRDLDRRHRFDYVLLRRVPYAGDLLLEHLDADSTFALVFLDDAAAVWVRHGGPLAQVAERFTYRELPAGVRRLGALGYAAMRDSARRARLVAELEHEVAGSRFHAYALGRLGSIQLSLGDYAQAERYLREALAADPRAARAHERLGYAALAQGRPREALAEFEAERRLHGGFPQDEVALGRAWQALGDLGRARRHYARELERDPGSAEARDSLASLAGR